MLQRPKASDSESDLLAFQEQFLASKEKPAVSLIGGRGGKRKELSGERDVVQLEADATELPTAKRSKFKESRRRHDGAAFKDPHKAMDDHDSHITTVLTSIQDRDVVNAPVAMPTRMTKYGFPTVHELDLKDTCHPSPPPPPPPSHPHNPHSQPPKKKSLFAQHFDSHSPEYFGMESISTPPSLPPISTLPSLPPSTSILHTISASSNTVAQQSLTTPTLSETTPTLFEATPTPFETAPTSGSTQFASPASQALAGLLSSPGLVSGEGLLQGDISWGGARKEVSKIHAENVERLSALSVEELLQEKRRVEQVLGPDLVAFLKKRTQQREKEEEDKKIEDVVEEEEGEEEMVEEENRMEEGGGGSGREATGVVAPSGWLHMDKVEREKMEWMTDVVPEAKEGGEVRFGLDGLVIPRGTILPSHLGLHHHGNDPAAAGYTLPELLGLVRSAVLQQRVLSLQTLARVTERARCGEFCAVVSGCVLSHLSEAGLPLLLRYALDDGSLAVISAALSCLHSLLVPQGEEYLLDEYSDCYHGNSLPNLRPHDQDRKQKEEEEEEEDDSALLARDMAQGYLKMHLLLRLRYILEVLRPPLRDVTCVLEVITRVARHSLQAASEVVRCPRLMDTIFREFLPLTWNEWREGPEEVAYGCPQPAAMRLMQVICSAGRHLTAHLLSSHKLMEVVLCYVMLHPSDLPLSPDHAYPLSSATLRTWRVVLSYGLAPETFRDTYPVLARQLYVLPSLSLSSLSLHRARHLAELIWLLEPAVCTAASLADCAIPWTLTSSLIPPLLSSLSCWLSEAEEGGAELVLERLVCVRTVLHVIASFFCSQIGAKVKGQPVELLEQAEALAAPTGPLSKLVRSSPLTTSLEALRATSTLSHMASQTTAPPPPPSLPTLHHSLPLPKPAIYGRPTMSADDYHNLLKPDLAHMTSADLLLAFLRLCLAVGSTHKGTVSNVREWSPEVSTLLDSPQFRKYVQSVCKALPKMHSCLEFGEIHLLYTAVKLFMMKVQVTGAVEATDYPLYHHLALHLLPLLPPGMETSLVDLLSTTVFHPKMLPELEALPDSLLECDLGSLSMRHPPQPLSESSSFSAPASSLLASIRTRLTSLSSFLLSALRGTVYSQQTLSNSEHLLLLRPLLRSSLRLPPSSSPLLPADWPFLPITKLYKHSLAPTAASLSPEDVTAVVDTLHVVLLLEQLRPASLDHLPPSTRLTRVLYTFMIGNDLFLEQSVHPCLLALLRLYSTDAIQQKLDFTVPIPDQNSFQDFYLTLLTQFSAVSYGDPLFSCYLLLPLQQRFDVGLHRAVWDQHSDVLRLLSLPLDQLPVKLECFLLPLETDAQLLDLYMGALATGTLRQHWSPVFYLIAVHHLHHFLFPQSAVHVSSSLSPLQRKLFTATKHLQNKDTQTHLLCYAGPSTDSPLGFHIATQLTSSQRTLMEGLSFTVQQ